MSIFNSDLKPEVIISALKDVKSSIRFVGILGSGMYPLARLLKGRGYSVSGSDDNAPKTGYTDVSGITVVKPVGSLEPDVGLVVYSLAIDEGNSEISYAISHGIPLISRAQLLGAVMSDYKTRISVSGSHGKSTVTALVDHILRTARIPHTTVSGATLTSGETFYDGGGDVFLAEACEYKDSFLCLSPTHQIITSVELDHTDYFKTEADICASFEKAARRAEVLIASCDDKNSCRIADTVRMEGDSLISAVVTYGQSHSADYRYSDIVYRDELTDFSIRMAEREFKLTTSLIGEFNLGNITAAVALADTLGIDGKCIEEAVGKFCAIDRRLRRICDIDGTYVYYDYAHHPSEIRAVIDALKKKYGTLTVIFRPHTFSRTQSLWYDFISELSKPDFTILLDIYPAREKSVDGVDSKRMAKAIKNCVYTDMSEAAKEALKRGTRTIALLGAGDVESVKRDFIEITKNSGVTPEKEI